MKKKMDHCGERGFTLVEMLMVALMLGIVMGAMYSIYISHQRTAYTSDETVEVQQNLRIAIDSISRDIRTAGLLLPPGSTPISSGTATTITLSSGCPTAIITRITPSTPPQLGLAAQNQFAIDSDGSGSSFNDQDYVRVIHPSSRLAPGAINVLYQVHGNPTNLITLNTISPISGPVPGVNFNTGDVICKLSSSITPLAPNTIQYYVGNVGTCPVGQQCLLRVDENNTTNVIAQNIANNGLQFQYLLDRYPQPNETNAPASTDLSVVRAVRVTVIGQTVSTVGLSGYIPKTREMETIIQLRNR
jgi:prepilin-type N-terminal cleavage/methylation domain-containing protein